MFDINFFQNTFSMKKEIAAHQWGIEDYFELFSLFERQRSVNPYLFNIETTNNCNMTCVICPRTTEMERKIENMDRDIFKKVAEQVSPHTREVFNDWVYFIEKDMGVRKEDMGENPFYFFISSQAVTMHGFGEPVLDPYIIERVACLSKKSIPTYFSCNPSNINLKKIEALFEAGLRYIKFSIDSLNDEKMKEIRGRNANFNQACDKILQVLDMRDKRGYPVTIIVCMIKLTSKRNREVEDFLNIWRDKDVYSYIKSQDNKWYFEEHESEKAKSHYETQYCEFPWTSLSVMVDGTVVPCTQDYNCEMPLGNAKEQSLKEIWNSKKYMEFRMMHIKGEFPKNYRCKERCDLKLVADYLCHR